MEKELVLTLQMESPRLIDSFGRIHDYLRISLTDACNLRCRYCMPNETMQVTPSVKLMQLDEIVAISKVFTELGVKKIRLTGGEPLMRKDAATIMLALSELPVKLSISTNALLADRFIPVFKQVGIDAINVSLDSLDAEAFFAMTQRNDFDEILTNIHALLAEGFRLKVNMVVLKGINEKAILDFVQWTKDTDLEVRFIEFMPFQGNRWNPEQVFSYRQMLELIGEHFDYEKLPDAPNDTAKHYRVKGFTGKFACITTITEPFCASCNRLRLTADGKMKNCLFSTGESDILAAFRRGEDIKSLLLENVSGKKRERGGIFDSEFPQSPELNRSMIKIGG